MSVLLNSIQTKQELASDQLELLEKVIEFGLNSYGRIQSEVSLVLVDNDYIQELNLEYRGLDQPTDVLSFAFDEVEELITFPEGEAMPDLLGDIYISVERAAEQSESYGHSLKRELCYLAVHGLLHLLGFDHQQPEETALMRQAEEKVMAEFSLGRAGL